MSKWLDITKWTLQFETRGKVGRVREAATHTIISEFSFIQHTTSTLMRDVGNPYPSNSNSSFPGTHENVIPQWFIKFLDTVVH